MQLMQSGHLANITVYHVNPHRYGAVPYSMNTGDTAGDLFFDLFQVVISPLACQNETESHACSNPEATGADLVVNKLRLEVDTRYSGCERAALSLLPIPAPPWLTRRRPVLPLQTPGATLV